MKAFAAAAALAAVVASPAFAQAPRHFHLAAQSAALPWDAVVEDGKVIGQDPDPNVRLELRRDYYSLDH
jgi:hypothetical protein